MKHFILLVLISLWFSTTMALPAFPGAEGWGATENPGGRGGTVVHVTNINNSGTGSLRDVAGQNVSNRIIVFDVGGVINAMSPIVLRGSNVTLAGQTGPGSITIKGAPLYIENGNNRVIRFVRIRGLQNCVQPGETNCVDAVRTDGDNILFDHVSASGSCDETFDLCGSSNVTLQWCFITESGLYGGPSGCLHNEGDHNYGLIQAYLGKEGYSTFHHNYWEGHELRCPLIGSEGDVSDINSDIRNNVIHNCNRAVVNNSQTNINLVGNIFKPGASTPQPSFMWLKKTCYLYEDNNYHSYLDDDFDPWTDPDPYDLFVKGDPSKLNSEVNSPSVTTHSYGQAYDLVMSKAGCLPKDSVDRRLTAECGENVETMTYAAAWGVPDYTEPLTVDEMSNSVPTDSDNDGMADSWETANGLNVGSADHNGDHDSDGYTNIEEYLNDIADILQNNAISNSTGGIEDIYNPDYDPVKIELGVTRFHPDIKISAYPNPFQFNGVLKVRMQSSSSFTEKTKVFVYDVTGKKIAQLKASAETVWNGKDINGNNVAPGLYVVQVKNSGKTLASEKIALVN